MFPNLKCRGVILYEEFSHMYLYMPRARIFYTFAPLTPSWVSGDRQRHTLEYSSLGIEHPSYVEKKVSSFSAGRYAQHNHGAKLHVVFLASRLLSECSFVAILGCY